MLSWLPRQRARMERIEVEAETMISDFGVDAYFEARRRNIRPVPTQPRRIGARSRWRSLAR